MGRSSLNYSKINTPPAHGKSAPNCHMQPIHDDSIETSNMTPANLASTSSASIATATCSTTPASQDSIISSFTTPSSGNLSSTPTIPTSNISTDKESKELVPHIIRITLREIDGLTLHKSWRDTFVQESILNVNEKMLKKKSGRGHGRNKGGKDGASRINRSSRKQFFRTKRGDSSLNNATNVPIPNIPDPEDIQALISLSHDSKIIATSHLSQPLLRSCKIHDNHDDNGDPSNHAEEFEVSAVTEEDGTEKYRAVWCEDEGSKTEGKGLRKSDRKILPALAQQGFEGGAVLTFETDLVRGEADTCIVVDGNVPSEGESLERDPAVETSSKHFDIAVGLTSTTQPDNMQNLPLGAATFTVRRDSSSTTMSKKDLSLPVMGFVATDGDVRDVDNEHVIRAFRSKYSVGSDLNNHHDSSQIKLQIEVFEKKTNKRSTHELSSTPKERVVSSLMDGAESEGGSCHESECSDDSDSDEDNDGTVLEEDANDGMDDSVFEDDGTHLTFKFGGRAMKFFVPNPLERGCGFIQTHDKENTGNVGSKDLITGSTINSLSTPPKHTISSSDQSPHGVFEFEETMNIARSSSSFSSSVPRKLLYNRGHNVLDALTCQGASSCQAQYQTEPIDVSLSYDESITVKEKMDHLQKEITSSKLGSSGV